MSKITKRILSGVLSAGMILTAVCAMPFAANATEGTSATGVTTDTIAPSLNETNRLQIIDEKNGRYSVQTYYNTGSSYYDARESATEEQKQVAYIGGNTYVQYDLGKAYDMKSDSATNFLDIEFYLTTHETTRATIDSKAVSALSTNKATWQMLQLKNESSVSDKKGICYRQDQTNDKEATSSASGYKALQIGKDTEHKVRFLMDCKNAKVYMFMDGAKLSEVSYPNTAIEENSNYTQTFQYIVFRVPTGTQCGVEALKLSDAKVTVYDNTSTATLQDVYESGLEEKVTTAVGVVKRSNSTVSAEGTKYTMTCTGTGTEESAKVALPDKLTLAEKADATEETSGGLSAPTAGLVHFSTMLELGENGNDVENIQIRLVGDYGTDARETRLQAGTNIGFAITASGKEDQILPYLGKNEYKLDIVMTPVSGETATGKAYFYINGVYCGESMYKQLAEKEGVKPDKLYTIEDIEIFVNNGMTTSGSETQLIFTNPVVNTYYNVAGKNWTVDKVRSEVAGDAEVKYNTVKIADSSTEGQKDITVNIYGAIEEKLVILAGYSDNGTVLTYATKLDNTKRTQTVTGVNMTDIDSMRVFIWNGTTLEPYDTAVVYTAPTSAQ